MLAIYSISSSVSLPSENPHNSKSEPGSKTKLMTSSTL